MSFADYSNKKKKKQTQALGQASNFIEWSDAQHGTHFADLYEKDEEDIAPVKGGNADSWFKSGGFSDGSDDFFDFLGNLGETVVGTTMDLGIGVIKGAGRVAEGLVDLGTYGAAGVADLFGADDFAEDAKNIAKTDYVTKLTQNATKSVDQYSVLGNKMDMVSEGIGQVGALVLTGGLGKLGGLGTVGNTILTTGTMGLSGVGSGMSEAYNAGASDGEAFTYGLISGVAEAGTELMFGGLGKASNAIGLGKSAIPLDDFLAKSVTKNMTSRVAKNLTQYGIKASAEGVEEVIAGYISAHAKKGTYMSDVDFDEILENENLLEQFIVGAVTSGIAQSGYVPGMKNGSLRESIKTGRDFITGYTDSEQTVIDKEIEKRVAEAEKNGNKLTKHEVGEIEEKVKSDLDKGYITIDSIEEALGGDSYKAYKDSLDQDTARQNELEAMKKEYDALYKMKNGEKSDAQIDRQAELKKLIDEYKLDSNTNSLKAKLSDEVFNLVKEKDIKLVESYNEKARKGQAFEADLSKYKGRQREAIERAIKSGVLNNTNRSHELVDILSKIEADKGIVFDYADNAKLKESGFAVEGKTVNGFEKNGTVTLNVQSAKAWESTVGHEIGHVLEGTEAYSALRESLFKYAESKGELESRRANLTELYKDMDADIDAELTADLLGDYLFNDGNFIKDLTANRNLFQKIYDEIKYLCKIATGKELTEIEKVKREFDKAWKELSVDTNKKTDGKVNLSVSAETDSEYMSAVESGDMETAQKLVDEVAIKQGFDVDEDGEPDLLFHGTDSFGFTTIDTSKSDDNTTFWATPNMGVAGSYYSNSNYKIREIGKEKVSRKGEKLSELASMEKAINAHKQLATDSNLDVNKIKYVKESTAMKKAEKPMKNAALVSKVILSKDFPANIKRIAQKIITAYNQGTYEAWAKAVNNVTYWRYADETGVKFWELDLGNNFNINKSDISKITKVDPDIFKMMYYFGNALDALGTDDFGTMKGEEITKLDVITSYNELVAEKGIYGFYHKQNNPFIYDCLDSKWDKIPVPDEAKKDISGEVTDTRTLAKWAFDNGYDSIKLDNVIDVGGYALQESRKPATVWAFKDPQHQIKSADPVTYDDDGNVIPLSERFNLENNDIRYSVSKDSDGNELSLAVQKRFANSKAVDENGNLKVLYHGTASGEFYTFDKSKGSVEGDFGSGFYFTDNETDVENNYEGGGADFENKVTRRAEQIESEEGIDYSEAEARARKELYVGSNKHTVYLNIENPAIVGETNLFDYESYAENYDREDYDSDEDYEGDVEQLIADDIDQIIWDIERNVDVNSTDGIAEILWSAANEGGIDIEQLKANINNLYLEDSNGNLVGNEVTRQIIESLGYDGIIDNTVSTKFNMGLSEDTTHYIVFKPNQIKSIDNQNPTDNPDIRYSLSEKLDNGQEMLYNGNRGETYVTTDEFRNLQAECQGMSDEDIQLYHSGNKQIDDELRANLTRILRAQIDTYRNGLRHDNGVLNLSNKGNEFNMCKAVDGSLFHDVFEIAQKHLRNGELVDLHTVETTDDGIGYNDCYNYLSDDGLSGFSITPDGDLISVFNASGKGGFLGAIAPVVKESAKTLDCYNSPNQPLRGMYEKVFGFKTASLMDYNMEYDHDNIAENHGMPQIAFMVNTESNVETKQFTKDQYDEAVAYRNGFVMSEDIAPVKDSLSYEGEQPSSTGTPLQDLYLAPTKEDVSQMENTAQPVAEDTTVEAPTQNAVTDAPMPDGIAPITEEEFNAMRRDLPSIEDVEVPPEMDVWYDYSVDSITIENKPLKQLVKRIGDSLGLNRAGRQELSGVIQDFSRAKYSTKEELFSEIKKRFGEQYYEQRQDDIAEIKKAIRDKKIYVSPIEKSEFGGAKDYADFVRRNLGKIRFSKDGISVDQAYEDLRGEWGNVFPEDIVASQDRLNRIAEVANLPIKELVPIPLSEETLQDATDFVYDGVREYHEAERMFAAEEMLDAPIDESLIPPADESQPISNNIEYSPDEIAPMTEEEANALQNEKAKADAKLEGEPKTRKQLHSNIINDMKATFSSSGYDFDDVLSKAKNLSTFSTVDNTPQRVMEKALGYKEGQVLADLTVNKVAQNETEGIKWLNSFTDRKNGLLAQISKQYKIKPGSKESAAAQMYAEGFYVAENNDIVAYGDAELAADFPDENVRWNIKGLASDPRIRQIYDETLYAINKSRTRNAYPEIQKLDNYFLHFRAMDDTFSKLGIPFNPNDIRAKDLPTDLNGVTADLKPGQPFFASAMHRTGKRTSFDLLGGLERYLTSAKNQIYHIDDIQTLRALRNYIADTYGQANGLEGIDTLTEEEAQERIEQVYGSHLSTFAKFLNEEANILAGKTALIDRGLEGVIGRRGMTFLDTVRKQTGSNMVGYNISSSLTNFIPIAQTLAKSSKFDFLKAFAQTTANKFGSIVGKGDNFAENSPVMIRRKGADRFHRTPFQKVGDAGYFLMGAVDNISTELIARTKFNELTRKGMSEQQAHLETDKWVSRLMGDRSLGQMPQLYNSKTLGFITQFQLEVRNQLDSQYYDTIQEAKVSNEEIENRLARNAKTAAKVTSTFVQLAVAQHLFGKAFESVAGYNPAFDIIEVLSTMFGFDDEEDSEDTVLDNLEQGFLELLEDLPYTSAFTGGGRIPMSSALPISELITGKDSYGNEKSRWGTLGETLPYYVLPGGYGQIKKTSQGLGMFSDEHPIAGSYTDSGNLRFPVEDTLGNRIQAGIFGQYANENAREYFDNDYAPLKEKQIQEFIDVELPIADYWKYREGLSGLTKLEEKADYINGLDIEDWQKNVLINNLANRKDPIDMTNYDDYGSFEEFDYASKNPDKYAFAKSVGGYSAYKTYSDELYDIKADKDSNGKTINGSRKEKVLQYINNLDADYETKLILFKSEYPSDDTYNQEIIEYINNRDDLTYQERIAIYTELGFTVKDGYIYW